MLDAKTIQGFSETVLALRYDDPKPTPAHHIEMWDLCCSENPQVAIAAPRGSAKSTAVTFAYVLASILFREHSHVLILSANEELASGFLNDIKVEFNENETLCKLFAFKKFTKERDTEIIGQMADGHRWRIIVKGAEQRMRGLKWERKRPSLVLPDDIEDEELVQSEQRRIKFRRWFYGAVKPILKDGGKIRMVGTIMHMDSLLMRFMPPRNSLYTVSTELRMFTESDPEKIKAIRDANPMSTETPERAWKSILYRAHNKDFTKLLWPSMYSAERLKTIRQDFAEQGMLDVYGQEYLNDPIDETTSYYKKADFLSIEQHHRTTRKIYYAACDLAITQNKRSAYTAIIVGGMDSDRILHIVDVRRERMDSLQIAEELFSVQDRWSIDTFRMESENIQKAIGPFIYERMGRRRPDGSLYPFINIDAKNPTKDKEARGQTLRAMMRAGRVRFDKEADWYADLEEEVVHFPKWPTLDQADCLAWLALLVNDMVEAPTDSEAEDEEYEAEWDEEVYGRNGTTGY